MRPATLQPRYSRRPWRCKISTEAAGSPAEFDDRRHAAARKLYQSYIFGLGSFGALAFGERDALALAELFKTNILQIGRVEKQVFGLTRVDKAKALVHQSLDCPFSHRK